MTNNHLRQLDRRIAAGQLSDLAECQQVIGELIRALRQDRRLTVREKQAADRVAQLTTERDALRAAFAEVRHLAGQLTDPKAAAAFAAALSIVPETA